MWNPFREKSEEPQVRPYSRDAVLYQEGDFKMVVDAEMCVGPIQRAVLAGSIQGWMPPHEGELVADEKKRQILRAVVEYWEKLGKNVVVEDRQPWCPS